MDRVQLNIRLPVPLVAALKTQAQQQGITLTALVEQQLSGDSKPASSDLAAQLAAIEQRLVALEQQGTCPAAVTLRHENGRTRAGTGRLNISCCVYMP